ncbi:MAG: biopolymer transporter ExbD [Isosphaeraceae bacterium]|nr:biopolymer transporter ExbD [Isosphaeraceae bacterium]
MASTWDVLLADRLETLRGLTTEAVRSGLRNGSIRPSDLARPGGSTFGWSPISDLDELRTGGLAGAPGSSVPRLDDDDHPLVAEVVDEFDSDLEAPDESTMMGGPASVSRGEAAPTSPLAAVFLDDDDDDDQPAPIPSATSPRSKPSKFEFADDSLASPPAPSPPRGSVPPPWEAGEGFVDDEPDPLDEDEAAAGFTLSRTGPDKIEELDLAAMVDVAFQLVLFFLVTASTVLYKSLEIPKPNDDAPPQAATQGRGKSLDDMKANFILVEIDAAGAMKLDREPLPGDVSLETLAERLRAARKDTDRNAMLLSADFATPHKNAVLAYDAANEIGLRIAIARPKSADSNSAPPPPVAPARPAF